MNPTLRRALTVLGTAAVGALRRRARSRSAGAGPRPAPPRRPVPDAGPRGGVAADATVGDRQVQAGSRDTAVYDVDRLGLPDLEYAPEHDDLPDPGEVVWTWVPYDDDPTQGKDRPALVLAREGAGLVVAQMTSGDNVDGSSGAPDRWGRRWLDVGSGAWDREGRESEVRLDRLLWVDPVAVRREGAALPRDRFDEVAAALRELYGRRG